MTPFEFCFCVGNHIRVNLRKQDVYDGQNTAQLLMYEFDQWCAFCRQSWRVWFLLDLSISLCVCGLCGVPSLVLFNPLFVVKDAHEKIIRSIDPDTDTPRLSISISVAPAFYDIEDKLCTASIYQAPEAPCVWNVPRCTSMTYSRCACARTQCKM